MDLNDLIEVIFVDGGTQQENHPFHLHGYSFAVLGMDKVNYLYKNTSSNSF